jgi:hypothetical protein
VLAGKGGAGVHEVSRCALEDDPAAVVASVGALVATVHCLPDRCCRPEWHDACPADAGRDHGGGRWGAYCPTIHRQIASTT